MVFMLCNDDLCGTVNLNHDQPCYTQIESANSGRREGAVVVFVNLNIYYSHCALVSCNAG